MKIVSNIRRVALSSVVLLGFVLPTGTSALFESTSTAPDCIPGNSFETFATGTVNGQNGWRATGPYDQEIVPNYFGQPTFGCKALRISDATTSVFIYDQTFSAPTADEAGESTAINSLGDPGAAKNRFIAEFDIASTVPVEQPGMHMSVSPDRGDGTRMSSIGIVDTTTGMDVYFDDVIGTSDPVTWRNTPIASLLRGDPHTVKLVMDFVEGASNDIVQVFINGNLVHTGTSWENFYRFDSEAFGGPTPDASRTVNSLVFYSLNPAHPDNLWKGYLIDNFSLTATTTPVEATTTPPVSTSSAPIITLNGSSTVNLFVGDTFTDEGATALDDVDGSIAVTATGTVDTATIGSYVITYTATDSHSNTASTTRTVNVAAVPVPVATSTVPIITINGSSTINLFVGTTFTDEGATAVSGTTTVPVIATGTVDTSTAGNYTILYTATSSSDEIATTTRSVNVFATTTAPAITLNGSSTLNLIVGGLFTDLGATAVDAVGNTLAVTATGTVNTSTAGTYTLMYSATDQNSNTATTSRTVTVTATAPAPLFGGGGGGISSGGGYFIFSPLPDQSPSPNRTESPSMSPISVGVVSTTAGEVLGVARFNFQRNLRIGMTGDDVEELQKILIKEGDLLIAVPTKYFGRLTQGALKKWQKRNNLPAFGYFGPMTRAIIVKE